MRRLAFAFLAVAFAGCSSSSSTSTSSSGSSSAAGGTSAAATSGSGATTGTGSGSTTSGGTTTGGGNSLSGPLAFTPGLGIESLNEFTDGGLRFNQATVMLADLNSSCTGLQNNKAADGGPGNLPNLHIVGVGVYRDGDTNVAGAGTYPVRRQKSIRQQYAYGDAGIDLDAGVAVLFYYSTGDDAGTSADLEGVDGTVSVSAIGLGGFVGSFSGTLDNHKDGGAVTSLSGSLNAPFCAGQ